ncbi:MAG TPA: hypothetical protein PLK10_14855 [Ottowia sp.]|nr:hypothetical protein [Ottowia sp.]
MSTLQDFGGYFGRVFDAKTLIALALIGCATWLATIKILDAAAWVSMCTTVGAFWGVGAVAGSPGAMQALSKLGGAK